MPDYRATAGDCAAFVLTRIDEDVTHVTILTHWESLNAIESFAGIDISVAKYYPEDAQFLLEFEPHVQHYKIRS